MFTQVYRWFSRLLKTGADRFWSCRQFILFFDMNLVSRVLSVVLISFLA